AGETVSIVTTGGGGYGPPEERDPEAVLDDVRDGLYDADEARRLYAVVVRAAKGDWELDVAATQVRRESSASSELVDRGRPWPEAASGTTEEGRAATEQLRRLGALRPDTFCVGECPRQGLAHRCPLWNAEAIEYWTPANLRRWIERHCPRADAFAGELSSARVYS